MMLGMRRRRGFGSLLLLLTVLEHPTGAVGGLNCDFEGGTLCSWKNTGTEEWTVQPGRDGDPSETGPALDHTTNTSAGPSMSSILSSQSSFLGHFLLASPNGDPIGNMPMLESPPLHTSADFCFSFWFFMHGAEIGMLKLMSQ